MLQKNLELFQEPLQVMHCSLEDFQFRNKASFGAEGEEEEIVEMRFNNYAKQFQKKVKRLTYEVV